MNYCNKCGDPVEENEKFCNKCGNKIQNTTPTQKTINTNNYNQNNNQKNIYKDYLSIFNNLDMKTKNIIIGIVGGIGLLMIFVGTVSSKNFDQKYYFDTESHGSEETEVVQGEKTSTKKKGKYNTIIVYDNTYSGVSISNEDDANKLISKDSVNQKGTCPKEIKEIENNIIKKYGITAVNLCEMDPGFAKEIGKVIGKIYDEYPSARGHITNLSLANTSMTENFIAAFMPIFNFATSDAESTFPWVIKTQIILNTKYFLNEERLQSSVTDGSNSGHFPPNATIYSPVAHEFGHYLSFLAMIKNYKTDTILLIDNNNINSFYSIYSDFAEGTFSLKMIKEAYENYKKEKGTTLSIDEWRGTISQYALAKNNEGEYIWDETIAEAFHDVYLNDDKAQDASKYVIKVLKSKLGS